MHPLSGNQLLGEAEAGGYVPLRAFVPETLQVRSCLLGLGPRGVIVHPEALHDSIASELREAATLYQ